nr:MAG TPA_asm: hypothetical protein [Bacteriophage sp.]
MDLLYSNLSLDLLDLIKKILQDKMKHKDSTIKMDTICLTVEKKYNG